jgi:2-keto-4-pentenoate hydratase
MVVPANTVFGRGRFYKPEVEAELVIELKDAIDKPVGPEEVRAAAAGFRLAIEVADTRYADKPTMGVPAVIADMNSCGALVIGDLQPIEELGVAATAPVNARLGDGALVQGLAPEMRPNPLEVVSFLSRFVTARGHVLPAGTIVTTGTHTPPTRSDPGLVGAEFEGFGRLGARLSEPRG